MLRTRFRWKKGVSACVWALSTGMVLTLVLTGARDAIGGSKSDGRPVGAPTAPEVTRDDEWFAQALHGIEPPYAPSLFFLEDQGNWYTPFTRPGMTGRYDLRRWHEREMPFEGSRK